MTKRRSQTSDDLGLTLHQRDGLELFVAIDGSVFASGSAIGRMINKHSQYVNRFVNELVLTPTNFGVLKAKIPTATGLKTSTLYDETFILAIFERYKPDLLEACKKVGIKIYLHGLVGISYKPMEETAPQFDIPKTLPSALRLAADLAEKLDVSEAKNKVLTAYKDKKEAVTATLESSRLPGLQTIMQKVEDSPEDFEQEGFTTVAIHLHNKGIETTIAQRCAIGRHLAESYRSHAQKSPQRKRVTFYCPILLQEITRTVTIYPLSYTPIIDDYLKTINLI